MMPVPPTTICFASIKASEYIKLAAGTCVRNKFDGPGVRITPRGPHCGPMNYRVSPAMSSV